MMSDTLPYLAIHLLASWGIIAREAELLWSYLTLINLVLRETPLCVLVLPPRGALTSLLV